MGKQLIYKYFVTFHFPFQVRKSVRTSKEHPSTRMSPSHRLSLKSLPITCCNLQMSDVCSHVSCLVQSQCCQLIFHINVSYIQLLFRHDSPFHTYCVRVFLNMEQGSDLKHLKHTCRTADKYKSYVSQALL
jgi:hypothetical protein